MNEYRVAFFWLTVYDHNSHIEDHQNLVHSTRVHVSAAGLLAIGRTVIQSFLVT